jgi:hypothetical protein
VALKESDRFANSSAEWTSMIQRIKSIKALEDAQEFCHIGSGEGINET